MPRRKPPPYPHRPDGLGKRHAPGCPAVTPEAPGTSGRGWAERPTAGLALAYWNPDPICALYSRSRRCQAPKGQGLGQYFRAPRSARVLRFLRGGRQQQNTLQRGKGARLLRRGAGLSDDRLSRVSPRSPVAGCASPAATTRRPVRGVMARCSQTPTVMVQRRRG